MAAGVPPAGSTFPLLQTGGAAGNVALGRELYTGEVLTAFDSKFKMMDLHEVRHIPGGQTSAEFFVTGRVSAVYHKETTDILVDNNEDDVAQASSIPKSKRVITLDGELIQATLIPKFQEKLDHHELRSPIAKEQGQALARIAERKALIKLMRTATDAGVLQISTDLGITTDPVLLDADWASNGSSAADSLFTIAERFVDREVPTDEGELTVIVKPRDYFRLLRQVDLIDQSFNPGGNGSLADGIIRSVGGINLLMSTQLAQVAKDLSTPGSLSGEDLTMVSAHTGSGTGENTQGEDYKGDFSNVEAIAFHRSAIGSVMVEDISVEMNYIPERRADLITASMAFTTKELRPESVVLVTNS